VSTICVAYPGVSRLYQIQIDWEVLFDISQDKHERTATNYFKITNFAAVKCITDAFEVEKALKEPMPMLGSMACIELASQVFDAK
jgi:hypothetical protein